MYKLRDYQQKASDAAVEFFYSNAKKNSIIVLPTGSGKSLVIADIASRLDAPTLIFQPSKEILEQNYMKLQSYGIWDCSVYSASFNQKEIRRITFATIGSVRKASELFKAFKYIIIDECHLVNPKEGMYEQFLTQLGGSRVLGLTATTPYRLHSSMGWGAMLKFITRTRPRIFDDVLYNVQISTLSDMGYLAKLQYYQMSLIDQRRLKANSTGADFSDKSLLSEYKRINFYQLLCDIIQRLLNAQRTGVLVFTKFIKEAERLSRTFDCCAIVSGSTPKSERERILSAFKRGEIKVVANVGVLTTGFDYPELDTVVLARPTMSLALYYQMIGRAIRPHENKPESWIVDVCNNYARFGRVEDLKLIEPKPGLYQVSSKGKQLTNTYFQ